MRKRGWPLSVLDEILGTLSPKSNTTPRSGEPAIRRSTYRYAYADSIRLEQYREWLASRVRPR